MTLVQTFESTGEAQYVSSELSLNYVSEGDIVYALDIDKDMSAKSTDLLFQQPGSDATGGRQHESSEKCIKSANSLFVALADSLENTFLNFDLPYDSSVADIIEVMGQMDYVSLKTLFTEIDIGTSYRQETVRNLFFEIIPRIGTAASVLLTRDVIVDNLVKPSTAIQLLISLPFHIAELNHTLVIDCEILLSLSKTPL